MEHLLCVRDELMNTILEEEEDLILAHRTQVCPDQLWVSVRVWSVCSCPHQVCIVRKQADQQARVGRAIAGACMTDGKHESLLPQLGCHCTGVCSLDCKAEDCDPQSTRSQHRDGPGACDIDMPSSVVVWFWQQIGDQV